MHDDIAKLMSLTPVQLEQANPRTVSEALARALLMRALQGDPDALRLVVSTLDKAMGRRRAPQQVKIVGGGRNGDE